MESPKGKEAPSVAVLRDCNEKRERERDSEEGKESRDCYGVTAMCCLNNLWSLLQHMFCDSFRINEIHFMWLALVYVAAASHHSHPPGRGDHSCRTTSSCKDLNVNFFEQRFWSPECSRVPLTHDIVEILLGALGHPGTSFGNATTSSQLLETTYGGAIDRQVSQWLVLSLVWWFYGLHCK